MSTISENDLQRIKHEVESEFPYDPALQQVHIARKILSLKAEREGVTFLQYVKSHAKRPGGTS